MRSISLILFFVSQMAYGLVPVAPFLQQQMNESNELDVIVYFKDKASLEPTRLLRSRKDRLQFVRSELLQTAKSTQEEFLKFAKKKNWDTQAFYVENAILIKGVSAEDIRLLQSRDAELEFIGVNARVKLKLPNYEKPLKPKDAIEPLKIIKADRVWDELDTRGEGIVVAGQDTGYLWTHESLTDQYRGSESNENTHDYNWHDAIHERSRRCSNNSTEPCDDQGHGTHTMGTIVGFDGSDKQIGVAPEAQWIGCRNMNGGVGTVASYLECFEFFLAPYPVGGSSREDGNIDYAPHIINNSWGCPRDEGCQGEEFLDAIRALKEAGIATVVSAGNNGPGCGTVSVPPGMYAGEVMSVGAYNRFQDKVAFFSSRGPSSWSGDVAPNLIAPGSAIHSASFRSNSSYTEMSGTSMAGPMVAGVLALLWSHRPELIGEVDESFEILQRTSTPKPSRQSCSGFPGGEIPNANYGWGMIDAYKALTESD